MKKWFKKAPPYASYRDAYMAEVERLAARNGVSDEVTRALLLEIGGHLDATIQARMETGDPFEVADQLATKAFGNPKKIVSSLAEVHRPKLPRIDRRFLISAMAMTGVYSIAFAQPADLAGILLPIFVVAALGWFAFESYRARRLQLWALAIVFVPTCIAVAVFSSIRLVTIGGSQFQREYMPELVTELQKSGRDQRASIAVLEDGYAHFQATQDDMIPRGYDAATGAYKMRKARSHQQAEDTWELLRGAVPEIRENLAENDRNISYAIAAQNRPWFLNIPGNLPAGAAGAWMLIMACAIVHAPLVFVRWFVGEFKQMLRQRKRQGRPSEVLDPTLSYQALSQVRSFELPGNEQESLDERA